MYAACNICTEIFTGNLDENIHSTPCGHLFHYVCLIEWLQRSKSCPQCQAEVSETQTIKLYFRIDSDSLSLQELLNLKLKLLLQTQDIKNLNEATKKYKNQANRLRNEVEENEEKIKNHETLITSLRGENKVMKSQLKKLSDDKLKSAELVAMLEQSESPQCSDGLGGHLEVTSSTTDRATLIREVEEREPNEVQSPLKRLKTSKNT
ncbi:hypothetical protein V9T40_007260 [Parthenolecanium corni]|uniref:RING-type domain-containing protein n=1 Tax=Parthenolecanium corni TaxID=536013 RepID=A0AAN9YBN1_9HEMI